MHQLGERHNPMLVGLLARNLSPSKERPVLPWRGLVGTTRGLQYRFQGLLFRLHGRHQPFEGLGSYLPCIALANKPVLDCMAVGKGDQS